MKTDLGTLVLERMLEPVSRCFTPELARSLVALRADAAAQKRIEELADRNTEGRLTPEERAEYEAYVRAGNLIGVLQAKARAWLAHRNGG